MGARYAQHFLVNRHAVQRIADHLEIKNSDSILEIGPGKGIVTEKLLVAGRVVVIEVDERMVVFLRQKFGAFPNLDIRHQDFLKFDLNSLVPEKKSSTNFFKIIGNLPYNLTSPILRKLSDWTSWSFAVLMVQKEVGDRICAKVGESDYGALTVGMNLVAEAERLFDLSETSFDPAPRVKSSVIRLIRREKPLVDNVFQVQRVVQAAFQQRRKTVLNSFSHGLNLEKSDIQKILEQCHIDPGIRPERLSVEKFIELTGYLSTKTSSSPLNKSAEIK